MNATLHDKSFIITGGAGGIGLATARALMSRGAQVEIWDHDAGALTAAAVQLRCACAVVDVRDAEQVAAAFAQAAARAPIDGIIHCAGVLHTGRFEEMPHHEHLRMAMINLVGTALVAHAALPYLKATRGSLVLLGSVSAFIASPEFATYAATKAGVFSLAQSLRIEMHEAGVHVGIANPLFVSSAMLNERVRQTRGVRSRSLFIHIYTPEQVAASIISGVERRRFMIWTGIRPRLIYWLSRYGAWFIQFFVQYTWEEAK
jgi:short-subunit dehydrogenase